MATAEKPVISKYKDRMDKAVQALKEEFASLRTGRASASLLDQVMVEAYGAKSPLNQVAAVSVPEPRSISVNVWDRGLVVSVEKAIRNAGLGLNPVVELVPPRTLPRTSSGKLARSKARNLYLSGEIQPYDIAA